MTDNNMPTSELTFHFDPDLSLLVFTAIGQIDHREIVEITSAAFAAHQAVNTLWDLTEADLSELDHYRLQDIIKAAKSVNERRPAGAKTALAAKREDARALLSLFRALNLYAPSHIDYRVFSNVSEAKGWIAER